MVFIIFMVCGWSLCLAHRCFFTVWIWVILCKHDPAFNITEAPGAFTVVNKHFSCFYVTLYANAIQVLHLKCMQRKKVAYFKSCTLKIQRIAELKKLLRAAHRGRWCNCVLKKHFNLKRRPPAVLQSFCFCEHVLVFPARKTYKLLE